MATPRNARKIFVFILPKRQPKPPSASSFLRNSTSDPENARSLRLCQQTNLNNCAGCCAATAHAWWRIRAGWIRFFWLTWRGKFWARNRSRCWRIRPVCRGGNWRRPWLWPNNSRFHCGSFDTAEFDNPDYLANPNNRCYFCKHELFTQLAPLAQKEKFAVIAYGENASDVGDHRPGAKAAGEFEVRAPLKEAGLTKSEIRALSAQLGLPTADKPQMACLSSRVPYGDPVTPQKLSMIEQGEYVLRDLGFYDLRVRHHEMRSAELGARNGSDAAFERKIPHSALRIPHCIWPHRALPGGDPAISGERHFGKGNRRAQKNRLCARDAGFGRLPRRKFERIREFTFHASHVTPEREA